MGQGSIFIYCLAVVCLYIWSLKSETAAESRVHGAARLHSRKPVAWAVTGRPQKNVEVVCSPGTPPCITAVPGTKDSEGKGKDEVWNMQEGKNKTW